MLDLLFAFVREVLQDFLHVFEVDQKESLIITVLEDQGDHARLCLVELEETREENRSEFTHGRTELHSRGSRECIELSRESLSLPVCLIEGSESCCDLVIGDARHRHT